MMFINYARLQVSGCDFVSGKTLEAGWPVHKDTISICTPNTIVHLVLNMALQMLLKILLCNFLQSIYCQRATRVLDFRFLSTSYHKSKTASDATQRQIFLQLRETYSDKLHGVCDTSSISYRLYAAPFYSLSIQKYKGLIVLRRSFFYTPNCIAQWCCKDTQVLQWSKGVKQMWKWLWT